MSKLNFAKGYIKFEDLYVAYRKAKSEAFYDSFHSNAISFANFESDFNHKLSALFLNVTDKDNARWDDIEFIGGFRYAPKALSDKEWVNKDSIYYRSINPMEDWWQRYNDNDQKKITPDYRLIMTPTTNFQIISALWILKVGHKFDEKLDKALSYGNRLRRQYHELDINDTMNGPINTESPGLFNPYFIAYKKWRSDGLDSVRGLLESNFPVTAITMDLEGFYHNVSPSFLLQKEFLHEIGVELTQDDILFTRLFISSLKKWHISTLNSNGSNVKRKNYSLPVGLSASKVISNALLYELDKQMREDLKPAYYGRYVDDIFIVFKTPVGCDGGNSVLSYIEENIECIKITNENKKQYDLSIGFKYAKSCNLKFGANKQKIFNLSGKHGLDFIDQISSQIQAQSSEYRMLPELPENSVEMANKTLLASSDTSLIPDALRKADVVSIRRLGLALLLKDIESYTADLSAASWINVRQEFYGLVDRYLLTPKGIFDLFVYIHRTFKLMIVNNDFDFSLDFIKKINKCFDLIEKTSGTLADEKLISCKKYLHERLYDSAIQSATVRGFDGWSKLKKITDELTRLIGNNHIELSEYELKNLCLNVLHADFGYRPYKDYWHYSQKDNFDNLLMSENESFNHVLRLNLIDKFCKETQLKTPHLQALVFPTRPQTIQEIAFICPKVLEDVIFFKDSIFALRGAGTYFNGNVGYSKSESGVVSINIPSSHYLTVKVALTNFLTEDNQYELTLEGKCDESLERYKKINKLINDILKCNEPSDYIVFPECSIPLRWAINISYRLGRQKKSLIAGIECYVDTNNSKIIRNDCLLSLTTVWPGYDSNFLILQSKNSPSHGERKALSDSGLMLYSSSLSNNEKFPTYKHGGFHFGVILCSDLTNPLNRTRYQGLVDCLFVLEWNPDVKTFSYLIEGASHDTHSFIVQVNNRKYGDSRVRAPYRADFKRDTVRVKGGVSDTYVIAEIKYGPLREFQKNGDMTDSDSEFKPVPVGFEMCKTRM